jgi:RhtB (resistance to homoserine/threonine) family protein
MLTQFVTICLLMSLAVISPGPDFVLVTKNTLLCSRRAGLFTSFGIGCASCVHISYCAIGLAMLIVNSLWILNIFKYLGASYMLYLGITSLVAKKGTSYETVTAKSPKMIKSIDFLAFRQGFFCSLLNPKAILYFLALFTVIIKPNTPAFWIILYAIEMFLIITLWFISLTFILSYPSMARFLGKIEKYIAKVLGIFLIGFGVALVFLKAVNVQ